MKASQGRTAEAEAFTCSDRKARAPLVSKGRSTIALAEDDCPSGGRGPEAAGAASARRLAPRAEPATAALNDLPLAQVTGPTWT